MKEHGFLFIAAMVRAMLEDLKTNTRRPITFDHSITVPHVMRKDWYGLQWSQAQLLSEMLPIGPYWSVPSRDLVVKVYPRVQPGDHIWVRETWSVMFRRLGVFQAVYKEDYHRGPGTITRKDILMDSLTEEQRAQAERAMQKVWTPSIHMPRWASRLDLDVLAVRSHRIQEISAEDARAEGCNRTLANEFANGDSGLEFAYGLAPLMLFTDLWDSINVARGFGWATNHPVWVYEFERVGK